MKMERRVEEHWQIVNTNWDWGGMLPLSAKVATTTKKTMSNNDPVKKHFFKLIYFERQREERRSRDREGERESQAGSVLSVLSRRGA